jgi:hypothetical protein
MRFLLVALSILGFSTPVLAQDASKIKKALGDDEVHSSWIYNDLDAGFAAARKSGKPMLIVLRCVT